MKTKIFFAILAVIITFGLVDVCSASTKADSIKVAEARKKEEIEKRAKKAKEKCGLRTECLSAFYRPFAVKACLHEFNKKLSKPWTLYGEKWEMESEWKYNKKREEKDLFQVFQVNFRNGNMTIRYFGDRLIYKNQNGTWKNMIYRCEYIPKWDYVERVRFQEGTIDGQFGYR